MTVGQAKISYMGIKTNNDKRRDTNWNILKLRTYIYEIHPRSLNYGLQVKFNPLHVFVQPVSSKWFLRFHMVEKTLKKNNIS